MLLRYLKKCIERICSTPAPQHPLACRCWELPDGTPVVADTTDSTDMDDVDVSSPSFLDFFKANKVAPSIGSLQPNNYLTASVFAQQFLSKFNSLNVPDNDNTTKNGDSMGTSTNVQATDVTDTKPVQ